MNKEIIITPREFEIFLVEEKVESLDKFKGWILEEIDIDTGYYDESKLAMHGYEIIITDPNGIKYHTFDRYSYSYMGEHCFHENLKFELYIPKINLYDLKEKILLELRRTIMFFGIHPETEPNSEMQDRMNSLIELQNKIENTND